jgi:hypothetical protein
MPPIDPAVLRARTAALAGQMGDPAAAAAGVRRLLEYYADLTHRPSPKVVTSAATNEYKVPAPVLRAIVNALRGPAQADPAAGLGLAAALWAGGSREARRIAAELLGQAAPGAPAEALALIETWAPQVEGAETADALAELGLGALMRAEPGRYLEHARRWAAHPGRWVRRLGLSALMPLVKDRQWDNVPGALAVVRQVMTDGDAEVRKAAAAVLTGLGPKSPAEVRLFLREQALRSNNNANWIIRNALGGLDEPTQAEIIRLMRSQG